MDAVKFIQEKNRMCTSFGSFCDGCPLSEDSILDQCSHYINLAPEKAVGIVAKWARENPVQTNGMKFKSVFGVPFEACVLSAAIDNTNVNKWVNEEYKEPIRKEQRI